MRISIFALFLLGSSLLFAGNMSILSLKNDGFHLDIYQGQTLTKSQRLEIVKEIGRSPKMLFTMGIADDSNVNAKLNAWDIQTGKHLFSHALEGSVPGWVQGPTEQIFYDENNNAVVLVTLDLNGDETSPHINVIDLKTNQNTKHQIPIGKRFPTLSLTDDGVIIHHRKMSNLLYFSFSTHEFSLYPIPSQETRAFDHLGLFKADQRGKLHNLTSNKESLSVLFNKSASQIGSQIGHVRTHNQFVLSLFKNEEDTSLFIGSPTAQGLNYQPLKVPFDTTRILKIKHDTVSFFDKESKTIVGLNINSNDFHKGFQVNDDTIDVYLAHEWN